MNITATQTAKINPNTSSVMPSIAEYCKQILKSHRHYNATEWVRTQAISQDNIKCLLFFLIYLDIEKEKGVENLVKNLPRGKGSLVSYINNNKDAEDLITQGARTSAAM